jgi:hypothetical protein
VIALLVAAALLAQAAVPAGQPEAPPATEIFVASLTEDRGTLAIGVPVNISNNPGYDNQPSFTPDGRALLFTSMRDGKQTDIYRYDIQGRMLSQLTSTPESEYSPTIVPDRDGFSVIRVEQDGVQRLWKFPFGTVRPSVILPEVQPVGYHAWADAETLVLFVLGDPPTLQIASARSGQAQAVARAPGRCLVLSSAGRVVFVQKKAQKGPWMISELDTSTRAITPVTEALEGREDYAILPDGRILMGSGSKIFVWNLKGPWREVADLSAHGIRDITRLAVGRNGHIAIVSSF